MIRLPCACQRSWSHHCLPEKSPRPLSHQDNRNCGVGACEPFSDCGTDGLVVVVVVVVGHSIVRFANICRSSVAACKHLLLVSYLFITSYCSGRHLAERRQRSAGGRKLTVGVGSATATDLPSSG